MEDNIERDLIADENAVDSPNDKGNKKKKLKFLIIIAAAILVAVIIGVCFMIPNSVAGAWELTVNPEIGAATPDQVDESKKVYYVFEEPDKYGKGEWQTYYDGGVENHKYEFSEDKDKSKINMGSVDLEYEITGSKLFGTAKITLTYPEYTDEQTGKKVEAQTYVLEQANKPDYENNSYDEYTVDLELVGERKSEERSVSYFQYSIPYTQTMTFNNNGVMTIRYESEGLALDRYMYYSYTTKDSKLTFSLVTDKENKFEVAYELDKDRNLKFIEDNTNGSIFADAFFGDITYYIPENLPKTTQATEK